MMRLGPVVLVAVLQILPTSIYDDDEAGAGCLGSSAPDTASDDNKILGPVYVVAVLLIPPVVTGADFLDSSSPDTTSNIGLRYNYWGRCMWKLCS